MKKFTLLLAVSLMPLAGMAQTVNKAMKVYNELRTEYRNQMVLQSKNVMSHLLVDKEKIAADVAVKKSLRKVAPMRKAEAEAIETPSVFSGYLYSEYAPGSFYSIMWEGNVAEKGDSVYFDLYGLDFVGGIKLDVANAYSKMGADSVVFDNSQIIGYSNEAKATATLNSTNISLNATQDGFNITKNPAGTKFGGYYFPETGELVITSYVGIFVGDETTPLPYTLYGGAYLFPEANLEQSMFVADISGTSDYGAYENANSAAVSLGGDTFWVYALDDDICSKSWVEVNGTSTNGTEIDGGVIDNYQLVSIMPDVEFKNGDIADLDFVNVAMTGPDADGYYNYEKNGFGFFATAEPDGGLTFESDGLSSFCMRGFSDNAQYSGLYYAVTDLKITIKNELVNTAIKGVEDGNGSSISTEYFDISGRKVAGNAKGLVIEKTRYANGKSVSRKVVK